MGKKTLDNKFQFKKNLYDAKYKELQLLQYVIIQNSDN